jgi:hypothetical protein
MRTKIAGVASVQLRALRAHMGPGNAGHLLRRTESLHWKSMTCPPVRSVHSATATVDADQTWEFADATVRLARQPVVKRV